MIPEFLGRLPVLVSLQGLTKELLMRILKEPKNAILKQYERLLALDEVKLVFEDDALEWIAERALEKDTGARALRAILEDFMMVSCMRPERSEYRVRCDHAPVSGEEGRSADRDAGVIAFQEHDR